MYDCFESSDCLITMCLSFFSAFCLCNVCLKGFKLQVRLFVFNLSVCQLFPMSVCLCFCFSRQLSVFFNLSVCLFLIYLSVCFQSVFNMPVCRFEFVCLSVCVFICLSVTHIDCVDPLSDRQKRPFVGDVIEEHHTVGATKVTSRHATKSFLT